MTRCSRPSRAGRRIRSTRRSARRSPARSSRSTSGPGPTASATRCSPRSSTRSCSPASGDGSTSRSPWQADLGDRTGGPRIAERASPITGSRPAGCATPSSRLDRGIPRGGGRPRHADALRQAERAVDLWDRVPDAAEATGMTRVDVLALAADAADQRRPDQRAVALATHARRDRRGRRPDPGGSDPVEARLQPLGIGGDSPSLEEHQRGGRAHPGRSADRRARPGRRRPCVRAHAHRPLPRVSRALRGGDRHPSGGRLARRRGRS